MMASLPIALALAATSVESKSTNGATSHPPKPDAPGMEWGYVDDEGRLVLSPELRRSMGIQPGSRMRLERDGNTTRLHRPLNHLAKVYIEPTNGCNLNCVTCFRNAWEYTEAMRSLTYLPSQQIPQLSLPKMDFTATTRDALFAAFQSGFNVSYAGAKWGGSNDMCDYIESGSLTVGWDGDVAPCWPLLHTHSSFLHNKPHQSFRHIVGSVHDRSLLDLWNDPTCVAYRERVQSFAFPPCTFCGGCDLSVDNAEDCFGNEGPVCGTCLSAQGLIRCL
jgi:hypothetical protein